MANHPFRVENSIVSRFEERPVRMRSMRTMEGLSDDGRTIMWARIPDVIEGVDAATLGILGDFVPLGVSQALGVIGGGTSLDNTLRLVKLVPTEWVLLDIKIHAIHRGFGHGLVNMFAQDGTLMATASQSCVVRTWTGDVPPSRQPRTPRQP
ncbi:MAG: thioesterase family protein [Ilumatobacteraceae bacterium]